MASPATATPAPRIQRAGCAMGGSTVTITLICTTVSDARDLFRRIDAANRRGDLTALLGREEAV